MRCTPADIWLLLLLLRWVLQRAQNDKTGWRDLIPRREYIDAEIC
jgi:hypothetical protein